MAVIVIILYLRLSSKLLKRILIKWNITRLRIPTCGRQTKNSYFTGVARNGTRDNRELIQIQLAIRADLLKAWLALTIG